MSDMTLGWLKVSMRVTSFSSLSLFSTAKSAVVYNVMESDLDLI